MTKRLRLTPAGRFWTAYSGLAIALGVVLAAASCEARGQTPDGARSARPWTLADCDRVGVLRAGSVFNASIGRQWQPICSYRLTILRRTVR